MIARTDALAVEGFDAALDRAEGYAEAGADMLFAEAPQSLDQMRRIMARQGPRAPLMANMVEGGRTPMLDAAALGAPGFRLVIFPGGVVRAIAATAADCCCILVDTGSEEGFRARMFDFQGLNAALGIDALLEHAEKLDGDAQ